MTLKWLSTILHYISIYLLYDILSGLQNQSQSLEDIWHVVTLGLIQLLCVLLRTQADAQHLYFGRRAALRVRKVLTILVASKALQKQSSRGPSASKLKKGKKDRRSLWIATSEEGGGDALISLTSQAERVSEFVATSYMLFGAPLELAIGCYILVRYVICLNRCHF